MLSAKPVGPRLLVKPMDAQETMRHGIVLPVEVGARESRGIVQAVGDGWFKEFGDEGPVHAPLGIDPGEVIVYQRGQGVEVELDLGETGVMEKFLVLHMSEVLLVLQETYAAAAPS